MNRHPINDDPDFTETIDTLHRLHGAERPQPDAVFVQQLRHSLMSNAQSAAAPAGPARPIEWAGGEARRWRPERTWPLGRFSTLATIAAVALLVASTAWFALRQGGGDPDPRGTYAAISAGTPAVDAPTSAESELPAGIAWSIPLAEGERLGIRSVTINNGVVYRLVERSGFTGIEALNAADGSVIWQHSGNWLIGGVSSTSRAPEAIAADEHHVYYFSNPSRLQALDAATGEEAWDKPTGGSGATVAADGGQIFVWDDTLTLNVFDAVSGEFQWAFGGATMEDTVAFAAGPAVFDRIVIVVTGVGRLEAIDRTTGESLWSYDDTFDPLNITIEGIYADGELSAIAIEAMSAGQSDSAEADTRRAAKIILSLDPDDGTVNWREEVYSSIGSNIAISGNTIVQIVDDLDIDIVPAATPDPNVGPPIVTQVVGRDATTGEIIWTHAGSEGAYFFYVGSGGPETAIARENDGPTTLLAANDGTVLCDLPDEVSVAVTYGVTEDGFMIALLVDGSLVAIDPATACTE